MKMEQKYRVVREDFCPKPTIIKDEISFDEANDLLLKCARKDWTERYWVCLSNDDKYDEINLRAYHKHMVGGFDYEGVCIKNPAYEELGRFEVNPEYYYGEDYADFMHSAARKLMGDLDVKYNRSLTCMSLDEYYSEFTFTDDERAEMKWVLDRINNE